MGRASWRDGVVASGVAGSLYAVTFGIYLVRYGEVLGLLAWSPLPTHLTEKIAAVAVAGFFMAINYRGASATGKIGAIFTLGQTLFLLFIGAVGICVFIRDFGRYTILTDTLTGDTEFDPSRIRSQMVSPSPRMTSIN
jgi:amino acid transporter